MTLAYLGNIAAMGGLARSRRLTIAVCILVHLAALGLMASTEYGAVGPTLFLLSWVTLNLVVMAVLGRPAVSAILSLGVFGLLVVLSQFKFSIVWTVINFFDVLIIDSDTVAFLWSIFPDLRATAVVAVLAGLVALMLAWRIDPFRVSCGTACLGALAGFGAIVALCFAFPEEPWQQFRGVNHVSTFVRSGVSTVYELSSRGWIDFDENTADRLRGGAGDACHPSVRPPNIIMVLDEASFDAAAVPGIKLPPGYGSHFESFDGRKRSLIVEGSGGPTWYTEYNVLTGLSARSYGRLSYYVTRIAAGHVKRGLPLALRRCGYKTVTLYPAYGAFLSARSFQKTTGISRFLDAADMKAGDVEPDRFFFNQAMETIQKERGEQPLFVFVYTVFNHFPWWNTLRPELTPGWHPPGNGAEVDEYLRRQSISAGDYSSFKRRLASEFPNDSFLLVRFGDHQPGMARIIDPDASEEEISQRIMVHDPRYFTTYYAIDAINFQPKDMSSARDRLEAPYLPLLVQEAAGLPLDPSFVEQKRILERCQGLFFECAGGAEARRFNRLLIDAGLIEGMVSR